MQTVIPLTPGCYFHIFDRGVNRENIFREERNCAYFLALYVRHATPVAQTYAYCLLRNHFHLLVRIRTHTKAVSESASISVTPALASKAFNNFLTAYAKGMNKTYDRSGALFQHHFGRIPVTSDRYFVALVRYIHHNPLKHGFVENFRDWPYSSYQNLLSKEPTPLARTAVLNWFGGLRGLRKLHAARKGELDLDRLIGGDAD
jgi:REP element-mobilizing transposase RayT